MYKPLTFRTFYRGTARLNLWVILMLGAGLWFFSGSAARAAESPEADLTTLNTNISSALQAAQSGDLPAAQKAFKAFDDGWFNIEDSVKARSKTAYRDIEQKKNDVAFAFSQNPPDRQAVVTALQALDSTNKAFYTGQPAAPAAETVKSSATVATVLGLIKGAQDFQAKGDYSSAATEIKEFQTTWLDVEGQVKTRSVEAYSQTENDMALAYKLLNEKSPEASTVLDRMYKRLEPFTSGGYGIFDAATIILREGLEALLVVIGLLTFLKKSGNSSKQVWVWAGTGAGLALSILLALGIQLIFSNLINGGNRELIEGFTGLVAAAMLFYVSYWMHSKSSAVAWQRYIKQKSSAAMAKGSLFGLALLAFLAIFREGAETALFYLGIGPSISTGDLAIGIGSGLLILLVLGALLMVAGLRIPMGPFFTVASFLVFYICFKFIGTGIHALQLAGVLPTSSAEYLPENSFFGLFPTWETTGVQLLVLSVGVGVVVFNRIKKPARPQPASGAPAGALK